MIVIVDYGLGNLGSIQNMLKKIGVSSIISNNVKDIEEADKIILPGVGKFDAGMQGIEELGLLELLNTKVLQDKIPILGICLGMQLLTKNSEEGCKKGLGWINAETKKIIQDKSIKVPHMGWNTVDVINDCQLTKNFISNARFYFVHSYYVTTENPEDTWMRTSYGIHFASAIHRENIYGVQFHPEKSHRYGLELLRNFTEL